MMIVECFIGVCVIYMCVICSCGESDKPFIVSVLCMYVRFLFFNQHP